MSVNFDRSSPKIPRGEIQGPQIDQQGNQDRSDATRIFLTLCSLDTDPHIQASSINLAKIINHIPKTATDVNLIALARFLQDLPKSYNGPTRLTEAQKDEVHRLADEAMATIWPEEPGMEFLIPNSASRQLFYPIQVNIPFKY